MKTYPYTCPKSKGREKDREFRSHAVSYPEYNQQSTNKNMCNGENSDPRDHCLRYCHFAAETSADGGNPIMNIYSYASKLMTADQLMDHMTINELRDRPLALKGDVTNASLKQ